MESAVADWLQSVSRLAFTISITLLVLIDAIGAALIWAKRDRAFVNRWTSPLLGANLLLLGTGLGIPAAAMVARVAVQAIAAMTGSHVTITPRH